MIIIKPERVVRLLEVWIAQPNTSIRPIVRIPVVFLLWRGVSVRRRLSRRVWLGIAYGHARERRGVGGARACVGGEVGVDGFAVCAEDEDVGFFEVVEQLVHVCEGEAAAGEV